MTIYREVLPGHGFDLARYGDAPAIVHDRGTLTYAELDALVRDRAALLGTTRRLVLVEGANEVEPLVTYLAALRGGHPVLLVPAPATGSFVASYDPDVLCTAAGGWALDEVRPGTRHELHADLALLLGTSGSTGTPKLVRLSRDNVLSNAAAIAGYLGLSSADRAATTLPLQYCYGLSVVNSHLLAGGSLWLTSSSVVDPGFWEAFTAAGATSIAGVPYTFDLLAHSGQDWTATPGLRLVTQAGGALPPGQVRSVASQCRAHDVDFFVMYGATEATARMAYLPADMAVERAGTIGVPIEGGSFELSPEGELVYSGPNVMLGYATSTEDLALGRTVHRLHTGDLARQHDDGLWEITGRCNRLAKLFGVRLDLDLVESLLAENAIESRVVATDRLVAFVRDRREVRRTHRLLVAAHCLPAHAVAVQVVEEFPLTSNGKRDYAALRSLVADPTDAPPETVSEALATVLGRRVCPDDSFVSLRGDSLSYVEVSLRLERILGTLPADWPRLPVRSLEALTTRPRRWTAMLETPVLLRALAIVLVVGSHTELFALMGGAHVLLALVGYNVARFALAAPSALGRVRALLAGLREVLVPTVLWIVVVALVSGKYSLATALMLNQWVGSSRWDDDWQFWFLEVVVWGTAGICALLLLPKVDALERSRPYLVALGVLAGSLALRYAVTGLEAAKMDSYGLATAFWCLPLGWLVARSRTLPQRLLTTAIAAGAVLGWFPQGLDRDLVVLVGVLALLWVPALPVPRLLVRPVGAVAAASFFIYLTHWVVYPPLDADHDFWALVASVAVGLVASQAWSRLRRGVRPGA